MQLDLFAPRPRPAAPPRPKPARQPVRRSSSEGGDLGEGGTVFVRHRWARRYILRVLDDGTLRVTLPRWGSKREATAFVERCEDWIARQRTRQQARPALVHPDEPALRHRALDELPSQLQALAAAHGITVTKVSIRNQRTRWGACSSSGSITLNWRLVLVPDFVREYVMIHELMHRRELNHSVRFWRHVAAACPRHHDARKWLLKEGQRLFTGQEIC
jgi:predicted metal-dependent hydrolase